MAYFSCRAARRWLFSLELAVGRESVQDSQDESMRLAWIVFGLLRDLIDEMVTFSYATIAMAGWPGICSGDTRRSCMCA